MPEPMTGVVCGGAGTTEGFHIFATDRHGAVCSCGLMVTQRGVCGECHQGYIKSVPAQIAEVVSGTTKQSPSVRERASGNDLPDRAGVVEEGEDQR